MAKNNPLKFTKDLVDDLGLDEVCKAITGDIKSDFIYSPHTWYMFRFARNLIVERLSQQLLEGTYSPGVPLTIEVPKPSRVTVIGTKRFGPNFSRPGSILLPRDRLFYHALAHSALPLVANNTNVKRSFSHRISDDTESIFVPARICWKRLQDKIRNYSKNKNNKYVLKLDIANCFGTLNQHTLVNTLKDAGYNEKYSKALEKLLMRFTGDRSSRGIIQGVMPSDLFGNFYMSPIDAFFEDVGIDSARYVDDIYAFTKTAIDSEKLMRKFITFLRTYDLSLNEAKSRLMPSGHLLVEEPDLELLFQEAVDELSEIFGDHDGFSVQYGFQVDWEIEEDEEGEHTDSDVIPELNVTINLFDSIEEFSGFEENIERFCIPLFEKFGNDYAVESVLLSFHKRPSMTQIYCSYLSKFLELPDVSEFLISRISDENVFDWQKMWIIAALMQADNFDDVVVKTAQQVFDDHNRHEVLRAASAIFIGKFGKITRRKHLINEYATAGSDYLKSAIFFSSRYAPAQEKKMLGRTGRDILSCMNSWKLQ